MVTPSFSRYLSIEDLLTSWLTGVLGYENVCHELPTNLTFLMPLVVVERFGGNDDVATFDRCNVDVDVFAPTRADALAHGETIRQALRTRLRGYASGGAVVQRVETISAPTAMTFDSKHRVRRCRAAYRIYVHKFSGI